MKLLSLSILLVPVPAFAADFTCRNEAAEITCDNGACEVKADGGFTPTSLSRKAGRLTVCAYSGCWSGAIDLRRTRGQVELLHALVRQQNRTDGRPGAPESLAVIHDRAGRTAQMRFLAFSNALTCG